MGALQRRWAAKTSRKLKLLLGGHCAICGTTRNLEFDCIVPCGHWHHRIEWSWRLSFYRSQFQQGNLQLLCTKHNARKSNRITESSI